MSESQYEDDLEETINELAEKADRAERANDLEAEIRRARDNIQDLAHELDALDRSLQSLLFYERVLTGVFDDQRPDAVDRAIRRVQEVSDISDDDVLSAAEDRQTNDLVRSADDARQIVRDARSQAIDEIRTHQERWEDEIAAARDLNQIIGGTGGEFEEALSDMNTFLDDAIWDEDRSPSSLEDDWDSLMDKWERNAGKHGWESFQREYELTDDTMAKLRQFAEEGSVRLDDVSVSIVEELKDVEELESAIRMEIDTR